MASTIPFADSCTSDLVVLEALLGNQGCEVLQAENAGYIVRLKSYIERQTEAVVLSLARSIEARDPLTQGHCERLVQYSTQLGARIGLPSGDLAALRVGSLIHDIGKIAVPDTILFKPGPLTPSERTLVEQHPIVGENICAPLDSLRNALPIIRHHHERMDGSGYPDGLRGEEIPLSGRVLQIADIYDALTSNRPYRKALSPEEALAELSKEADGGWLDRSLVNQFEQLIHETCHCLSRGRSMLVDYFH